MAARPQELAMSLLDNLEAMVAYWDKSERCLYANNAYLQWFGKTFEQIQDMPMKQLLGQVLYDLNLPHLTNAYGGKIQIFERTLKMPDRKIRYNLATYTPHIVDGEVEGIFVHVANVTSLKVLQRKLRIPKEKAEKLATHDFLTGLPNRVLLNDRINKAIATAEQSGRMFAGASLDLDEFKKINDTLGHQAGDQLLVAIATRIRRSIRSQDTATRLGGDEFFLLFANIRTIAQLERIANRVLDSVRQPVEICGKLLHPSCSLGIAIGHHATTTAQALIEESDRALYQAKKSGKNRYALQDYSKGKLSVP